MDIDTLINGFHVEPIPLPEIQFNFQDAPCKEVSPILTYTVQDIQQILNIGKSAAYAFVNEDTPPFKVLRIGTTIRISKPSFDAWLETL